jgi:hypothetical protein
MLSSEIGVETAGELENVEAGKDGGFRSYCGIMFQATVWRDFPVSPGARLVGYEVWNWPVQLLYPPVYL